MLHIYGSHCHCRRDMWGSRRRLGVGRNGHVGRCGLGEERSHVELDECALVRVLGAARALACGGGDVHEHGVVVVDGDVQVARLHVGHDVPDGVLSRDVAVQRKS